MFALFNWDDGARRAVGQMRNTVGLTAVDFAQAARAGEPAKRFKISLQEI
jgi:hypothetical protein